MSYPPVPPSELNPPPSLTVCEHCGVSIERCPYGCWHHAGTDDVFCNAGEFGRKAEPRPVRTATIPKRQNDG